MPRRAILPPEYRERGWSWPPRVAATSFLSYGVFADAVDTTAHARIAGGVLQAERRIVQATGEGVVAEVESTGFTLTVSLEGAAHPRTPVPGNVLSGTVLLTASLEDDLPAPGRGLWSRRG